MDWRSKKLQRERRMDERSYESEVRWILVTLSIISLLFLIPLVLDMVR